MVERMTGEVIITNSNASTGVETRSKEPDTAISEPKRVDVTSMSKMTFASKSIEKKIAKDAVKFADDSGNETTFKVSVSLVGLTSAGAVLTYFSGFETMSVIFTAINVPTMAFTGLIALLGLDNIGWRQRVRDEIRNIIETDECEEILNSIMSYARYNLKGKEYYRIPLSYISKSDKGESYDLIFKKASMYLIKNDSPKTEPNLNLISFKEWQEMFDHLAKTCPKNSLALPENPS